MARHRRASAPPPAPEAPTEAKSKDFRRKGGVVVSWEKSPENPFAAKQVPACGVVRLDLDGREVKARWSGTAATRRELRPTRPGQRVTIWRDSQGPWRCHLVEPEGVEATAPQASPRPRASTKPIPRLLVPVIRGELAGGASVRVVAERWSLSIEQVVATREQ